MNTSTATIKQFFSIHAIDTLMLSAPWCCQQCGQNFAATSLAQNNDRAKACETCSSASIGLLSSQNVKSAVGLLVETRKQRRQWPCMVQFVLVQTNCHLGHQLHQRKHVLLGCLHLKASIGELSTPAWICSKLKAYKLGSDGRSNTEQPPRYTDVLHTVQGC